MTTKPKTTAAKRAKAQKRADDVGEQMKDQNAALKAIGSVAVDIPDNDGEPVLADPPVVIQTPVGPATLVEPGDDAEATDAEMVEDHKANVAAVTIANTMLVIGDLPAASLARVWAAEFARKLGKPIHIMDRTGFLIETVDKAALDAMKAAKKAAVGTRKAAKASEPKAAKTAPEGKRLEVVQMCMRQDGASTKELIAATGWKGCPWAWTIGNNKNGTGLADKFGYGFHKEKVGEEVRYFLTAA